MKRKTLLDKTCLNWNLGLQWIALSQPYATLDSHAFLGSPTVKLTEPMVYWVFKSLSVFFHVPYMFFAYCACSTRTCYVFANFSGTESASEYIPEMHYSICAMSSAQLHNWCEHVHESKCGNDFHPALEPKCFRVPLKLSPLRPVVWPSSFHFWRLCEGWSSFASNYRHWSQMMDLVSTTWHSSVVPLALLSLRIPVVLSPLRAVSHLGDFLGRSVCPPRGQGLMPQTVHSSYTFVLSLLVSLQPSPRQTWSSLALPHEVLLQAVQST